MGPGPNWFCTVSQLIEVEVKRITVVDEVVVVPVLLLLLLEQGVEVVVVVRVVATRGGCGCGGSGHGGVVPRGRRVGLDRVVDVALGRVRAAESVQALPVDRLQDVLVRLRLVRLVVLYDGN